MTVQLPTLITFIVGVGLVMSYLGLRTGLLQGRTEPRRASNSAWGLACQYLSR